MRVDRRAHASAQHLRAWLEIMAERVFSNSRVNMFSNTVKLHTKSRTQSKMPSVFGTAGSNLTRDHALYERSIYERIILSEPFIENYAL